MTPMQPMQPQQPTPQSAVPVIALVMGVLSICFPPLILVAIVLAIVSLAKSNEPAYRERKTLAIIALVVPLAVLPIFGILAAIAIPNFMRFSARSKSAECKVNLKAAFTAQKSFYGEKDRYSLNPAEVGFEPERGNRFLYRFAVDGPLELRTTATLSPSPADVGIGADVFRYKGIRSADLERGIPPYLLPQIGIEGTCPDCNITMVCAGDIDNDKTVDVWSISTKDRTAPTGEPIPAGTPFNDVNDAVD